jgi:hypothetical protein
MMGRISLIRLIAIAALVPLAAIARTDLAHADPPSPGEPCLLLDATAQDNHGHAIRCKHMWIGSYDQVWQYSGSW